MIAAFHEGAFVKESGVILPVTILYKYRSPTRRARQIIGRRELYFSLPKQLNDPYDCQICIRSALRDAIQDAETKNRGLKGQLERFLPLDDLYDRVEEDVRSVGILSLSKRPDNIIMWTHYAANHSGFCVGLELSKELVEYNEGLGLVGKVDVKYAQLNPYKDFFEEIASSELPICWGDFWPSLLMIGMAAKAADWGYEEEVRVIRKSSGMIQYSSSELVEVIFGMNMEKAHREKLRKKMSGDNWGHVRFREVFRRDGFSIDIRDVG